MARQLLVLVAVLLTAIAAAQKGTIAGTITSNEGGSVQPMPFVNVAIKGTTIGGTTDLDGKFSFDVEPGAHVLSVSFVGYEPVERPVVVTAGQRTLADVDMKTQGVDIKEFEVVKVADREREGILLMERKEANTLVQSIGAQELKKKGAGDVAEGVQKMVGLSTVGGCYVVVRGLTDRYNSAYLNGMPLPSPDPDMKVAPLDIFPTSVVESISVTKAFSPELYGDFSGGAVDIATKRATGENILKVSLGAGVNSMSTFKEHRTYNGGRSDFWGRDDGTRSMPTGVLNQGVNLNGERLPFAQNFNPTTKTASPDLNFGLFGGTSLKLGEELILNVVATANHRTEYRHRTGRVRIINTSNTPLLDYAMESWQFNTQTSALGSVALDYRKNHRVGATVLWVNMSSDDERLNQGRHFDYQDDVYARRFTYRQNTMRTQQVFGRHGFGMQDRLLVEWSGAVSTADALEPDRRQLVYLFGQDSQGNDVYRFNAIDRLENHRWYSALNEVETTARAGISYRMIQRETQDGFQPALVVRAGAQTKRKDRDFGYDIFAYSLQGVNTANPEGVAVDDPDAYINDQAYQARTVTIARLTGPEAKHTIEQQINAAYLAAEFDPVPARLKVMAGLRIEQGDQRIIYRKQSDSFYQPVRVARLQGTDLLPYASVRFDVTKKDVVRASASKTISRPGFREMGPFEYTEFFAGSKNVGNPDLQNGKNLNADLRYERFFGAGELVAIGAFGKVLDNTIEKVALATASGQLLSFRNTGRAQVAGVELEVVKNIGTLVGSDSTFWNDLSVGMNAALLHSELVIQTRTAKPNSADVVLTNAKRPMQGASPYLVNFDLSYGKHLSDDVKATITLAYNVFGKRVFAAGANGLGDQYELPVNTLNLVLRADIGRKWQANLTCRNLLDARYRVEQDTPAGSSLVSDYRVGSSFGAGITYRIL